MIAWPWSDLFVQTITPLQADCSRPIVRAHVRVHAAQAFGAEFKRDIGVNAGLARRSSEMTRWPLGKPGTSSNSTAGLPILRM